MLRGLLKYNKTTQHLFEMNYWTQNKRKLKPLSHNIKVVLVYFHFWIIKFEFQNSRLLSMTFFSNCLPLHIFEFNLRSRMFVLYRTNVENELGFSCLSFRASEFTSILNKPCDANLQKLLSKCTLQKQINHYLNENPNSFKKLKEGRS